MTKDEAAVALREIGTILELQGENPFKCRAYHTAARTLETAPADLGELVQSGRLGELPGIGEALREKITTLVTTGKLPYLEKLRASIPPGLLALLDLPGLGPKKLPPICSRPSRAAPLTVNSIAWGTPCPWPIVSSPRCKSVPPSRKPRSAAAFAEVKRWSKISI